MSHCWQQSSWITNSFLYGSAMEKYNCTIVFDVYARTISAYDAGKSRGTVPIYLSYQNLVDAVDLEELTDDTLNSGTLEIDKCVDIIKELY